VFLKEKAKEKQAKKILYINESQNVKKKKLQTKEKSKTYQEKKHQSALSSAL